ncbi:endonuclease/exonuclease/phosphatase family protein [Pelagibius sp.]|uniref:endonuclease/exonuclease/phosphatase family protein n=1 Tax=Pelagibius sp. TaxID=1931238 RepID=UPI002618FA72|nr:endonuclease/exonuclease/phosphatase family protein [Pelagibius sp.]
MPDDALLLRPDGLSADERLSFDCVRELDGPSVAERRGYLDRPADPAEHRALFDSWPLLRQIEVREGEVSVDAKTTLRIVSWNLERGKYVEEAATLLRALEADVCLLSELDIGMARSGQRHSLREIAALLGQSYAFGTEFIEMSLGDDRERVWHKDEANERGLHGGGLLSARPLQRPALLRLERSGYWWRKRFKGEVRIGGRIAVLAAVDLAGTPVTVAAVHFESHSGPEHRAEQMGVLLDAIDVYAPGAPAIIGGDFNTNTLDRLDPDYAELRECLAQETPERFLSPEPFEPMFELARRRGYDWLACNRPEVPTTRTRPDGTPRPPHIKIDWFFTRGLTAAAPEVIPAVDAQGRAISDHEVLAVTVSPSAEGAAA